MLAKLELRHQYTCKKKNNITARENIEQKAKFKGQNKLNRGELEGARPFINVLTRLSCSTSGIVYALVANQRAL